MKKIHNLGIWSETGLLSSWLLIFSGKSSEEYDTRTETAGEEKSRSNEKLHMRKQRRRSAGR